MVALATVLVAVAVVALVVGLTVLRRRLRTPGSGVDSATIRRDLASNWVDVEAAAVRGGMQPDEIAEVRRRLLGA